MEKEYLIELLEEFLDFLEMKKEDLEVEEEVLEEEFVEPEVEPDDEEFSAMLGDIAKGG